MWTRCFNPRARAGRDPSCGWELKLLARVSIHAPARGATEYKLDGPSGKGVSIHAPARGATSHAGRAFLPRDVSIHAPARGATLCLGRRG